MKVAMQKMAFKAFHTQTRFSFAYSEKVLEYYEKPKNIGSFDSKDKNVGTGLVGAPACGDVMKLQIKTDENGKISDAVFKVASLS